MASWERGSERRPGSRDLEALNIALRGHFISMATEAYGPPISRDSREIRWRATGAFVLRLDTWVWFDHAATGPKGNTAGGDLLAGVAHLYARDLRRAIELAEQWVGSVAPLSPPRLVIARQERPRSDWWKRIWADARPVSGSPVEVYLHHRGITWDPAYQDVGFHPACPRGRDERLPAMVAAMRTPATNEITGIHRTYLRPDSLGKVEHGQPKMMLGVAGVVKLIQDAEVTLGLGLAEGLETALSVMTQGWSPVWAALSASGIAKFPVLDGIDALTIFADHDEGGTGQAAARTCARRWKAAGREVDARTTKVRGTDFNDVVRRAG